jgi:mannose-6-phosphate isomerase
MFYPIFFEPVYKNYIWGGRNLENFGKILPEGIVAESWEISCHPDGTSIISNGIFKGTSLPELISKYNNKLLGNKLPDKYLIHFPLLIKLIDANNDLSIQVHPDDNYAKLSGSKDYGKNEIWYIIEAKPGAKLVYGFKTKMTKDTFENSITSGDIEKYLNFIEVKAGDVINIPSGLIHTICKGIILAEIQQNSNLTYRVYDYNRINDSGDKRLLHIKDALNVIDFTKTNIYKNNPGLQIKIGNKSTKTYKIVTPYYSLELYDVYEKIKENANDEKFFIFLCIEGNGVINYTNENNILDSCKLDKGQSVFIPANLGKFTIEGNLKLLKTYIPDIDKDIIKPLSLNGFNINEIKSILL